MHLYTFAYLGSELKCIVLLFEKIDRSQEGLVWCSLEVTSLFLALTLET